MPSDVLSESPMLQREIHQPKWGAHVADEALIPGPEMRDNYMGGCSEMHIWRLLNYSKYQKLKFPKPIRINGRCYWRLGEIRHWIRDQEAKSRHQALAADPDPGLAKVVRSVQSRSHHVRQRGTRP